MKNVVSFLNKHYELWPLSAVVGVTICGLLPGFIVWSCWKKDFVVTRRKLRQINEGYDELVDMDRLYKEMDKKQRQHYKRRQSDEDR